MLSLSSNVLPNDYYYPNRERINAARLRKSSKDTDLHNSEAGLGYGQGYFYSLLKEPQRANTGENAIEIEFRVHGHGMDGCRARQAPE